MLQETDSRTTMDAVTKYLKRNEDRGYIGIKNAEVLKALVAALRKRKARTYFAWVRGHSGHEGNEKADRLAKQGTEMLNEGIFDLDVSPKYCISGAKLKVMTQSMAYRAIRERKSVATGKRRATTRTIDMVKKGLKEAYGVRNTDKAIWVALSRSTMTREVAQFVWKALHDLYMVGEQWLKPGMRPELQERATCKVCGVVESLEHILTECRAVGRTQVLELMRKAWENSGGTWREPTLAVALGMASASLVTEAGARNKLMEDLWTTLWSESVHLIWKLRCERVIQNNGRQHCPEEVRRRWCKTVRLRRQADAHLAERARRSKRSGKAKPKFTDSFWPEDVDGMANATAMDNG
ncbi:hypothetical protein FKP32DRAFT_1646925 [Trametes sanguinea]|nr:hypothetical protein FKP32DRAFT_1646925 [Trametes sanguinea]